jgi:DNA-binding MarR family transcriptional regulator
MAFLDTSNLLARRIDQQLRQDGGVTQPLYELLTRLAEAPQRRLRMTELAELLVTSRSGLTYQVAQLEKAGLVRRESCADDERGVLASPTDIGMDVLHRTAPGHVRVVRDGLIDQLDRERLLALANTLEHVRAQLRGKKA